MIVRVVGIRQARFSSIAFVFAELDDNDITYHVRKVLLYLWKRLEDARKRLAEIWSYTFVFF